MCLPLPPTAPQNVPDTKSGPGLTIACPRMGTDDSAFATAYPPDADPLHGAQHVEDLYLNTSPMYEGRCAHVF